MAEPRTVCSSERRFRAALASGVRSHGPGEACRSGYQCETCRLRLWPLCQDGMREALRLAKVGAPKGRPKAR